MHDTEDITPSKKASKKCDAFKNTQTNELIKEATNTLKNLNELKTQHSSSKTADDIFCEMIAVHLKTMNEGAAKEFLKLDIHCAIITAIHIGNSPTFAGVNFVSPPMTPTMPHINHASLGCGQK